ncbi:MAG: mechanosensitive ion channel [Agathobacter sp.]|nr:mechanosensitive ion channel [Agathobacter sp.]
MKFILTVADTSIIEAMEKEKNALEKYLEGAIPELLDFCVDILLAVLVLIIGSRIIKWIVKILGRSMERANAEQGVVTFVSSLCKYALYFVLLLMILSNFGVTASSVIAVLGSAGLTLGLALQGSLSNFAGGVLILLLKPFVVGDYIIENANKQEGTVTEITIFYTKLLTVDNKAIMIPNGALSNSSITNVTAMMNRRLDLRFAVAYNSDIAKVKSILEEVIKNDEAVIQEEEMNVFVSDLLDSSMDMGLRCWVKKEDYWTTRWRIIENVKMAFDREGVEIPFPQMDVNLKK